MKNDSKMPDQAAVPLKIELLFPEVCNLFGDLFNMTYLQHCLPEAEFIHTHMSREPRFVTEDVDMIFMAPMTELTQERVIEKFMPHKARIAELMEKDTVFLFTGNAMEVLYRYIEDTDGRKTEGLGLLPCYAKRDMMSRINSVFLGRFEGEEFTGFKTQFTKAYPDHDQYAFISREKGMGMNEDCAFEGFHLHNFFGSYLTGPILILNPPFTQYLLGLLGARAHQGALGQQGVPAQKLVYDEAIRAAYTQRLKQYHAHVKK